MRAPILDRLADKFTVGDDCWEWIASRNSGGYGTFAAQMAHRVLYEIIVGPIPPGLVLDHLCHNHGCVRPSHCEPVTQSENVRRRRMTRAQHNMARKTECPHGHPYDDANTYRHTDRDGNVRRHCRTCRARPRAR